MASSALGEFHLELCHYIRGNLRQFADVESLRELQVDERILMWLDVQDEQPLGTQDLLLNWEELTELEDVARQFPGRKTWIRYSELHQRYVHTLIEVRQLLSKETSEEWARRCLAYGRQLEAEGLPLDVGIGVIQDWLFDLRELLSAIGCVELLPAPDGYFPTPTNPEPVKAPLPQVEVRHTGHSHESPVVVAADQKPLIAPGLDQEYSLGEAAEILGCDKKTVIRYIEDGMLEWRNAAPPSSTRPIYRLRGASVLKLRSDYTKGGNDPPAPSPPKSPRRKPVKSSSYNPKHIRRKAES